MRSNNSINYYISLITILLIFFLVLELKYPYYFFSDDNRTSHLPSFIHNYRAISNGEFPFFNFHQYLGLPYFSNFQSAVLYPFVYLSILLSTTIFGHYFFAIDILVIINLIIGSLGFYKLINILTKNKLCSFYGALIWTLSSFTIYGSTSWWVISGVSAYFPWMVFYGLKLYNKPNFKYLILLITARLLLFYIGHIEYFIYSIIFEFFTITLILLTLNSIKKFKVFMKKYFLSYFWTIIYSLPILIPAWFHTANSAFRNIRLTDLELRTNFYDLISWIQGLLYPFINDESLKNHFAKAYLSHIGYITVLLIIFCVIFIIFHKKSKNKTNIIILFFLFFISMLWSTGMLSGLIYYIPILNRFRWPFKLAIYNNFYLICISSFGFYFSIRCLKRYNKKIKISRFFGIILITLNIVNFYLLYNNFYISFNYKEHYDKIPLEEPLQKFLKNGRIFTLGKNKSDPYSALSLGYNYATLFDLYHIAGYDVLVPINNYKSSLELIFDAFYLKENIPIQYLRFWGVKWYILNKGDSLDPLYAHYVKILSDYNIRIFKNEPNRVIYKDNQALPLCYWEISKQSDNIVYKTKTNSIILNTENSQDKFLIINFLHNDFFKAFLNKKSKIPIMKTEISQMKIFVPKGSNEIEIKYNNPYFYIGILIVIVTNMLLLIYYIVKRNKTHFIK